MFNKGANATTMEPTPTGKPTTAPMSPFGGMRQALRDPSLGTQTDPWNGLRSTSPGLSIDAQKRDEMFKGMMEQPQQQAQFSPAQFGGGGNQQVLAQYIASLLGKG